jgi:hypothetical protein
VLFGQAVACHRNAFRERDQGRRLAHRGTIVETSELYSPPAHGLYIIVGQRPKSPRTIWIDPWGSNRQFADLLWGVETTPEWCEKNLLSFADGSLDELQAVWELCETGVLIDQRQNLLVVSVHPKLPESTRLIETYCRLLEKQWPGYSVVYLRYSQTFEELFKLSSPRPERLIQIDFSCRSHSLLGDDPTEHADDHAADDHAADDHAADDHAADDHAAGDHAAGDHAAGDHAADDHALEDRASHEHHQGEEAGGKPHQVAHLPHRPVAASGSPLDRLHRLETIDSNRSDSIDETSDLGSADRSDPKLTAGELKSDELKSDELKSDELKSDELTVDGLTIDELNERRSQLAKFRMEPHEHAAWITVRLASGTLIHRETVELSLGLLLGDPEAIDDLYALPDAEPRHEPVIREGMWIDLVDRRVALWGLADLRDARDRVKAAWQCPIDWWSDGFDRQCQETGIATPHDDATIFCQALRFWRDANPSERLMQSLAAHLAFFTAVLQRSARRLLWLAMGFVIAYSLITWNFWPLVFAAPMFYGVYKVASLVLFALSNRAYRRILEKLREKDPEAYAVCEAMKPPGPTDPTQRSAFINKLCDWIEGAQQRAIDVRDQDRKRRIARVRL